MQDKFTIVQDDGYVALYKNGILIREHTDIECVLDEIPNLKLMQTDGIEKFTPRLEDLPLIFF